MIKIILATKKYSDEVVEFFEKYLDKNNDGVFGPELFCPFGTKAAVGRGQMMIILDEDEKVVEALRFYPRKRDGIVSLYQFALAENFRGKGLIKKKFRKNRS